jgi:hypothetical protein
MFILLSFDLLASLYAFGAMFQVSLVSNPAIRNLHSPFEYANFL